MSRVLLAVLVAIAAMFACTVDRDVLVANPTVVACGEAFTAPPGATCEFTASCTQPAAVDGDCCNDVATCTSGVLAVATACTPLCKPCTSDTACAMGSAICNGTVCEACPPLDGCTCPSGWTHLTRNGCMTCDCAPPATCAAPTTSAACGGGMECYAGSDCTSGCATGDTGCCSNQCAQTGCTGPIPVGCLAPCGSGVACPTCAATHCDCVGGAWSCTIGCVTGAHASCVAP